MSLKKKGDEISPSIQKIMEATKQSFDEISTQPRFGYFSIPPNQIIGDRFYSLNKEYNHKVVDRNVITEKRGIYTTIGKSGKGHDAYFQSLDTTDEGVQQRLMEGWKKDRKEHLERIAAIKNKLPTPVFKYPGVQHYQDEFDKNPVENTEPIYKDKPRIAKKIDGKIVTEKRGIFTQPMKKGFNNTPGIYFNYIPFHENDENIVSNIVKAKSMRNKKKRPQSSIPLQKAYKVAFKPAALKKNECFSNIRETYGYEDKYFENLKKMSEDDRKRINQKFKKKLPPGAISHMRPFTPAHLGKTGRDGLFDQRVWDCPQIPEKRVIVNQREKKEYERTHRKTPYRYNIVHEQSKFSPPIMTKNINMRSYYPCFFGK